MKYSVYNYVFMSGTHALIYNAATDGTILLQPELVPVLQENKDGIDRLADVHKDLYDSMVERRMIVPDEEDEAEAVVEQWKKEDTDPEHFYLTILPTLNCNLRCWYCYEEHKAKAYMTDETLERVYRFLDKLTGNDSLKYLHLSFFGGEPLLPFKKTVYPLLQRVSAMCKERKVKLIVHFTTNGVLLTPEVIEALVSLPLAAKPGVQITLDGNREKHDASRFTASHGPTYDTIVRNIRNALKAGMYVNNRFNYTVNSVDSLIDVLDEYKDLTEEERALLHFDFQQVWQESDQAEARQKALKLADKFFKSAFQIRIEKRYNRERCKSDADNQLTINYNGDLYSCTARDTTPEECEGHLLEDGTAEWNDRHRKRMEVKYGNAACRSCKIFPVCHGGCSQMKLEAGECEDCIRGYDEEQRLEVIKGRLDFILKTQKTSY